MAGLMIDSIWAAATGSRCSSLRASLAASPWLCSTNANVAFAKRSKCSAAAMNVAGPGSAGAENEIARAVCRSHSACLKNPSAASLRCCGSSAISAVFFAMLSAYHKASASVMRSAKSQAMKCRYRQRSGHCPATRSMMSSIVSPSRSLPMMKRTRSSPNFSPRVEPTRRGPVASAQVGVMGVMGARSEPTIQVWGRREITL